MNEFAPDTLTILPDPRMFRAARWAGRVCLAIAGIAIVVGLARLLVVGIGKSSGAMGWDALPLLLTGLWCGVSLVASRAGRSTVAWMYARRIANLLALCSAGVVVFWMRAESSGPHSAVAFPPVGIALSFVLLAIGVVLVDKRSWFLNRVVDVVACGLCLLLLTIVSDALLGVPGRSGTSRLTQISVVASVAALVLTLTLRQAEHGVLSVFLGVGTGSRLARLFAPILLAMPYGWSIAARLNHGTPIGQSGAAVLASMAVGTAVGILLYFAWRMSRMENEIHDLILRDEATRLYNQRGFHMLAEHALRLAERSEIPFSVLFIHMENLAQIHAELGSDGSSAALAEAGEILRATFRESDIKGRIGADEFAVAGQFDRAGISVAAMRLEAATAARVTKRRGPAPVKFSMGHVTTSEIAGTESLKEMLARAGQMRHQQTAQLREMRVN